MKSVYQNSKIKAKKKVKFKTLFTNIEKHKLFKDFLLEENLKTLNLFLRLKSFKYKEIPTSKKVKIKFLFFLSLQKGLFTKEGYQVPTTVFGKYLNVNAQTVTNYLKLLKKLGYIECSNEKWAKGFYSKRFKVVKSSANLEFCNVLNTFNGFFENFYTDKNDHKKFTNSYKAQLQKIEEVRKNKIPQPQPDKVKFVSIYKRSPRTLLRHLRTFNPEFLKEPRKENLVETQFFGYLQAFNYVCRKNKLSKNQIFVVENKDKHYLVCNNKVLMKVSRELIHFDRKESKTIIVDRIKKLQDDLKWTYNHERSLLISDRVIELRASLSHAQVEKRGVMNYSSFEQLEKNKVPQITEVTRVGAVKRRHLLSTIVMNNKGLTVHSRYFLKSINNYKAFKFSKF